MQRRNFLSLTALTSVAPVLDSVAWGAVSTQGVSKGILWKRPALQGLFSQVNCEGQDFVRAGGVGLLAGKCRLLGKQAPGESVVLSGQKSKERIGPVQLTISHKLHDSGQGQGEDLLQATLSLRNDSNHPVAIEAAFISSAQPSNRHLDAQAYVPLSAAGIHRDSRLTPLGSQEFLADCRQRVGVDAFQCHYLEPMASYPNQRTTRALLLAPVVDISHPGTPWHVAMFTSSEQPRRFETVRSDGANRSLQAGRCLTIAGGETVEETCFLLLHQGDARVAWSVFHQFAHKEDYPVPDWVHDFRVHYYDFLSSAKGKLGRRGNGYEEDLTQFREFHVGMATQHAYYPSIGDYLHPDRKTWQAMQNDSRGPVRMSLDKMRTRIKATRKQGARAAVYIHPVLLDDATPQFDKLRDTILVDESGERVPFKWIGPDNVGKNWRASLNSPVWREHICQQTEWIMELLDPDAIVIDETFAGIGYDHHPDRSGPMSANSIDLFRKMRAIVKSRGSDRALFSSDCSMTNFVMWADGEAGDHCYPNSLGQASFMQEPVRALAALGNKPWRPCAWHFYNMWQDQLELARRVGAGVGISNGWAEYTGLTRLPDKARKRILADIRSLV